MVNTNLENRNTKHTSNITNNNKTRGGEQTTRKNTINKREDNYTYYENHKTCEQMGGTNKTNTIKTIRYLRKSA